MFWRYSGSVLVARWPGQHVVECFGGLVTAGCSLCVVEPDHPLLPQVPGSGAAMGGGSFR